MELELQEVEGHKDLVRDMQSTAILNTNKNAYEKAIERHKNAQKKNEDLVKAKDPGNTATVVSLPPCDLICTFLPLKRM